jgi:hypothetical protein
MGLHIRDERQRQALTGLSQDQCDHWLPLFRASDETTQQQTSAGGGASGPRRRQPGGGAQGKRPTMAEQWPCVLSSSKTYPPCAVLGTPLAMARSKAPEHVPKLAPMLSDTRVQRALRPSRALATPEALHAA